MARTASPRSGSASIQATDYDKVLVIRPKLPTIFGIFDLPPDTCISAHAPHGRISEHLHDHLPHMHIRYGFEIPQQSLAGIDHTALEVAMMIKADHRVDCNPVFVARGRGNEGICLKIAGEDVHWVHNDDVGVKATKLFEATGRRLREGFYFSGFKTSDIGERTVKRYSKEELKRTIGFGLQADQHFQATWRDPKNQPIVPYDVVIFLSDDESSYYTFFRLAVTTPIGAF